MNHAEGMTAVEGARRSPRWARPASLAASVEFRSHRGGASFSPLTNAMIHPPRREDAPFSLDRLATADEHGTVLRSGVQLCGTRGRPILDAGRADALVRAALAGGDLSRARKVVRAAFAEDVYGLLFYVTGEETAALSANATCYRSLAPTIAEDRSLRSWVYGAVLQRVLAERRPRSERCVPLPGSSPWLPVQAIPDIPCLVTALRSGLSRHDRALLALHVDRKLSWSELAYVFLGPDADTEGLHREALRLQGRLSYLRRWVVGMAASRGVACTSATSHAGA